MSSLRRIRARLAQIPALFSRRHFLRTAAAASALPVLSACSDSLPGAREAQEPEVVVDPPPPPPAGSFAFLHGVASGDPYSESVVLWTRVTPGQEGTATVRWLIARDAALTDVVREGSVLTSAARDYTVKVVPTGLASATTYYFRFSAGDAQSPIGRTRTAPAANAVVDRLRFAFCSCSYLSLGYFNSYRTLAARADLDAVLHLGDYIYENGGDELGLSPFPGRTMQPANEIVSLADYRQRHAQYKRDVDLQEAHRQHPWIVVWDDHETTDNSYTDGASNHTEGAEGVWSERKRFGIQAYFEWMPVREDFNPLKNPSAHLYRRLRYGDLAEFFMLDTRLEGRDKQAANAAAAADPALRLMSATQEQWLLEGMAQSTARWKLIGQQTMLAPLYTTPGTAFTLDSWDGYLAQRGRVMDFIRDTPIRNVVVLTGDIHTSFAMEITPDPTSLTAYTPGVSGSVAVEMVCPSITTIGFPDVQALKATNRHMRYAEASGDAGHGYTLLDVTPTRCQGEWYFSATISQPLAQERPAIGNVWKADEGQPYLSAGTASMPRANAPALAP